MAELGLPWQIALMVVAPVIGALFGLVMHTRKIQGDLRVEMAHFKAFAAEKYVPFGAQVAFEREVVRRLERIEDKLDAQAKAFTGVIAGVLDE